MGLGSVEDVPAEETDGAVGGKTYGDAVTCSICLEAVADNGDRSWAKLQCGHQFHLDCIGSAFNIKGAMQCPNCRKIEKGQWLYANGCRSFPEFSMEDWNHEEDLYNLSYSEMSFGVNWCPYGSLARLPSSFEEGEFSPSSYHDLLAQHTIFAEPAAVSSGGHPCPYIAYFGPVHPSSSNSSGSISDAPNFNRHWTGTTVPSELPGSYAFPAMDLHYHNWDHHSSAFSATNNQIGGVDPSAVPSMTQRSARPSSEIPRSGSFMHPFLVGHSSSARSGSSVTSSMIPPYPGSNARARHRVQALQAYYQHQQPNNNSPLRRPIISTTRRTNNFLPHVGAAASSSDQNGGFYFYPPGSSGRNYQEVENPLSARIHGWERDLHGWERDHLPPMNQLDRDPVWAALHQAGSGSESGIRGNSLRRHGSERTSSQNRS